MQRGSFDTQRWPRSLAISVAVSVALHALVIVAQVRLPATLLPHIDIVVNHGVEIGLEEARPGAETPPPPTPAPSIEEPTPPPPPPPPRAERPRARPTPPPPPPQPLPEENHATLEAADAEVALADAEVDAPMLAEADVADASDESALAALEDAGDDGGDASMLALADVMTDAALPGVPGIASAAGSLAPAIPAGSVVTLLLRMDRIRQSPNGPRVGELLRGIRDWRQVLDGTEIDPVEDFNTVLLASADPFGTPEDPPDLSVIVRTRAPRGFFRASVEQMAGARARTSAPVLLPDGGIDTSSTLRDRFNRFDAGVLPRPTRPVWRRQGGAEVATIDRYMGPHAVILLGDDLAAIASPARVPQLLAVLGARTASVRNQAQSDHIVALLQADGLRNLLSFPGRATSIPTRADVVLYETSDANGPDGGVDLLAVFPYDDEAQPPRSVAFMNAYIEGTIDNINRFAGTLQGRLAAGSGAVHFDRVVSALRALRITADGSSVRITARLTAEEVSELLNIQRLAQLFG